MRPSPCSPYQIALPTLIFREPWQPQLNIIKQRNVRRSYEGASSLSMMVNLITSSFDGLMMSSIEHTRIVHLNSWTLRIFVSSFNLADV